MAKKKPARKAAAAKKTTAKRTTTAKKAARKAAAKLPRKAAVKKGAKKAPAKKVPLKKAARKAPAKKAAPKPAAKKTPAKPAPRKAAPKARKAAAPVQPPEAPPAAPPPASEPTGPQVETERPLVETVETTSAGIQALAPEHAAVDDLTSSGNELLDIFQKYDRNRTGFIEQAEFARLLEALGQNITDEELMIAFDIADTDRAGKISWKQFKNWWTSR